MVFHGFPLKNAKNFQLQLGQAPHMGMEARLPRTPAGQTKSKNSQIWKAENRRVPLVAGLSNIQQHHGDIMNVSLYNSICICVCVMWCDVVWCDTILYPIDMVGNEATNIIMNQLVFLAHVIPKSTTDGHGSHGAPTQEKMLFWV